MAPPDLLGLSISLGVLLVSLTVHEAAHAWSALRLGDPTARDQGRLSLNPVVHIDPVGTLLLPLLAAVTGAPIIGWARPVPVNVHRLASPRVGFGLVALAGPTSNLVLAVGAAAVLRALASLQTPAGAMDLAGPVAAVAFTALRLNLLLALFNLVPVPPLDGGNVLAALLGGGVARAYDWLRPYGVFVLYGLMLSGALAAILGPPYAVLLRWLML